MKNQLKEYIKHYFPFIVIFILLILLCFKQCSSIPTIHQSDNNVIKTKVKKLEFEKKVTENKVSKTDSVRIKYVIKWRLKIKDSIVYKPCEELIVICDTIIKNDSTEISQLKQVNIINDSIIVEQKIMLYNDSLDIRNLKKYAKQQKRQKQLAFFGLGLLGVFLLVK